jgi:cob(I)alamin adenosyltransferase
VAKDDVRIEAYGTVDELNSQMGLLLCEPLPDETARMIVTVQSSLFAIGAVLADPEGRAEHTAQAWDAEPIEDWIDGMDAELDTLRSFILPGGSRSAALAHVARTVCRRAERRVFTVAEGGAVLPEGLLPYLNRLSDGLFVLARFLNARSGIVDTEWHPTPRP